MDTNVSVVSTTNQRPEFVGKYVEELRDVLIAASASGLHTQLIGPPGCGKTAIAKAFVDEVYGEHGCMTRFNPTTPPSKVEGVLDYEALLGIGGKKMEWRLITDGTPYHPGMRAWIADEGYRGNDAVKDMFIDVLDRWDNNRANVPVVILTSNFLPSKSDERAKAVLDRFAMTNWVNPPSNNVREVVKAQLKSGGQNLKIPGNLPSFEEITAARTVQLTDRAIEAVANMVSEIKKAVELGLVDDKGVSVRSFGNVNHRRETYWATMLACTSTLYAGTNDFDEVHPKAVEALSYAWTTLDEAEFRDYRTIVSTILDPISAILNKAMTNAFTQMRSTRGKPPHEAAGELGRILQNALQNLAAFLPPHDERYVNAQSELQTTLARYIRGEYDD